MTPRPFERALVIGCSGAGKSTFSRALGSATGTPIIHLDQLYWEPGWKVADPAVYRRRLEAALAGERWIIDGSNLSTLSIRLPRADAVFWLDLPRWRCLLRVAKRVTSGFGRIRPDSAAGCPERFDPEFVAYIWNFHTRHNPRMAKAIAEHGRHLQLRRFVSDREAQAYLDTLR